MQVVDIVLSPYELVLREIEKGAPDLFDIDLEYLIEMFRKENGSLKEWNYFEEAGRFLFTSTKLLKLRIEDIFPSSKPERKRITIKEVQEVPGTSETEAGEGHDLSWLWDYQVRAGRPAGAKNKQERKLSWEEFRDIAQKDLKEVLHEQVDYRKLAEQVSFP